MKKKHTHIFFDATRIKKCCQHVTAEPTSWYVQLVTQSRFNIFIFQFPVNERCSNNSTEKLPLDNVLKCSGVRNFNYSVSTHYLFIYSCIHCLYLIIALLSINSHVGILSKPACNEGKKGKPKLTGRQFNAANHCWWCKHTAVHLTMNIILYKLINK